MNSRLKAACASLWSFLPLVAFRNWQAWDRLPARLAVHFDLAGRPNGWMSRESGLGLVLILMAVILGAATLVRSHLFPPTSSPRAVLGVFYLAPGAIYCGEEWILAYNLNPDPTPLHVLPIVVGSLVAVLALTLVFLGSGPSTEFPTRARLLAEEVHASPGLAWGMLVPAAAELVMAARVPAGVRIVLILSALVLTGVAVMAWSGFRYFFTPPGGRGPNFQFPPVLGPGRANHGLRGGPLESAWRIWHSRSGKAARLCLGKSGRAHPYPRWGDLPGAPRSRADYS